MSFKIKDSLQVGTVTVINSAGELVTPKIKDAGSAFNSALLPTTLTGNQTITLPDATGTLALVANIITPGAGALTVGTGAAAATNVAVTLTLSAAYNANSSTGFLLAKIECAT